MATPPRRPVGGGPVDPGGTTFGAPDAVAVTDVERGKRPTRKLIAIAASAVAIAVARIVLEALGLELDDDLEQLINAIVPLLVGYFTPNDLTPGGVPDAKPKVLDLTKEDGAADPGTIIMWALAVLVVFAVVIFIL
jgi:uncharacterized membrane protein